MSLGIVVKGPEGLVLAAESRITLSTPRPDGQRLHVNFDNATKLLSFSKPNDCVGAVTYGQAAIGLRTAYSFLPEFEAGLPENRLSVFDFTQRLSEFFLQQWREVMPDNYAGPNMTFVVGGFNEGEPYGKAFLFEIPGNPIPVEQNPDTDAGAGFGLIWGGQRELVDRLIQGYDSGVVDILSNTLNLEEQQIHQLRQALEPLQMPIPLVAMPLQDCVNLAIFFIRTTITAQQLTVGIRGVGGPIDVAIITRNEGLQFIQRKKIVGEVGMITDITSRSQGYE